MPNSIGHLKTFISDRTEFSYRILGEGRYELTSGIWKSGSWRHDLVVVEPSRGLQDDASVLYITGGDVNEPDLAEARSLADRSGLRVAMLFQIPNQPLFERWEDDLIAHTFEQFLETGDYDWPLLFPMARAAVRAMDVLEESGFRRFVVMGASKRGWTTWLAGATGDPRIVGIAPMVIDNLNFPAQMAHQVASWGAYSEQIEDYTSRDLQNSMESERGVELTTMMDPYSYLQQIGCPILIVNGANDRYWTVDALSLYWDALPEPKRCLIVPNAGHLLGNKTQMMESVSAFASACANRATLPEVSTYFGLVFDRLHIDVNAPEATSIHVWQALSGSLDFRESEWSVRKPGDQIAYPNLNVAIMVEARFAGDTGQYSLSTPVRVFRALT